MDHFMAAKRLFLVVLHILIAINKAPLNIPHDTIIPVPSYHRNWSPTPKSDHPIPNPRQQYQCSPPETLHLLLSHTSNAGQQPPYHFPSQKSQQFSLI
ncbi:hypothetical protein EJ08DRAFT_103302 [Tothia fuscella]|uniref:Uncharacterized protein n=1 Tax=Tothia fuscella TaxID=1048955 RepID=A0A9P4NWH7_9PEZI|nr:hypothetical protein EJ08DRAFT_103302 [Tothia fuscella]